MRIAVWTLFYEQLEREWRVLKNSFRRILANLSRKFSVRLCSVLGYCLLQGWPKKRYKHTQGAECHPWFGHTWVGRQIDIQGLDNQGFDIQGFGHPWFLDIQCFGRPGVLDVQGEGERYLFQVKTLYIFQSKFNIFCPTCGATWS